ncbi:TetR/AcrR family transcriptional regulator [Psychrobium sp. MM17-31]|uniref:TetR/AcrR family transcriptional regulator n=1 Tax=Psychrobium sp. MM17-31 TaxID=2917758 RepID=UPI001EF590F8|nr:TetR/AcrR family transcriptional regulator [Psychrobium sp. MM17-31]MCG7533048.1 TetR/AcrR family transcriptional regulator [Psychrobium sp. MM17-31]
MNKTTLSKGEQTKLQIIQAAAKLIYQQGFNHTGMAQVLKTAGVSKGSFYFHFKDKDELGHAVVDHYRQQFKQSLPLHLQHPTLGSLDKISAFHHFYYQQFENANFAFGCPIGNLTQELTDLCPVFAAKLNTSLNSMSLAFAEVIKQGQKTGEINPDIDTEQTANFIVESWEGAILRMKALNNGDSLNRWHKFTRQLLT